MVNGYHVERYRMLASQKFPFDGTPLEKLLNATK